MLLHGIIYDRPLRRLRPSAPTNPTQTTLRMVIYQGHNLHHCTSYSMTSSTQLYALLHLPLTLSTGSEVQGAML